jgi:hypothetical protein
MPSEQSRRQPLSNSFPHSFSLDYTALLAPYGLCIVSCTSQQGSLRLPCFVPATCQGRFARCSKRIPLSPQALCRTLRASPRGNLLSPPFAPLFLHNTGGPIAHTAFALLCCLPLGFVHKLATVLSASRGAGHCCRRFCVRKEKCHLAPALLCHHHTPLAWSLTQSLSQVSPGPVPAAHAAGR